LVGKKGKKVREFEAKESGRRRRRRRGEEKEVSFPFRLCGLSVTYLHKFVRESEICEVYMTVRV
jgi:hypothetical protein